MMVTIAPELSDLSLAVHTAIGSIQAVTFTLTVHAAVGEGNAHA